MKRRWHLMLDGFDILDEWFRRRCRRFWLYRCYKVRRWHKKLDEVDYWVRAQS